MHIAPHHKKGLTFFVLIMLVGASFMVKSMNPSSVRLQSRLLVNHQSTSETPVIILKRFKEPKIDVYYSNLDTGTPSDITLRIIRFRKLVSVNQLPTRFEDATLTAPEITVSTQTTGTSSITESGNTVSIAFENLNSITNPRNTTYVGTFDISLSTGEEYQEIEVDVLVEGKTYTLIDREKESESIILANNTFRNQSGALLYLTPPGEQILVEPQQTVRIASKEVSSYSLLFPGEFTNQIVDPAPHAFPAGNLLRKIAGISAPTVKLVNNTLVFNAHQALPFNSLILKLTDKSGNDEYTIYSLRNNNPITLPIPWADVPDIYQVATSFAFLNEGSSNNATTITNHMNQRGSLPSFASLNYLSPFQFLGLEMINHRNESPNDINLTYTSPTELSLAIVQADRFESISSAARHLMQFPSQVSWVQSASPVITTQQERGGTPLVLNLLTKQGTIVSKPLTSNSITIGIPPSSGIEVASSPIDILQTLSPAGSTTQRLCIVETPSQTVSLPLPHSTYASPIACWNEAEKRGLQEYKIRLVSHSPSTQSLTIEFQADAFTPTAIPNLSVTSYSAQSASGSISSSAITTGELKAIFYSNLNLASPQTKDVTLNGASFTIASTPAYCTSSCFFRLVYTQTQSSKVYFQEVSPLIPHKPVNNLHLQFCFQNKEISDYTEFSQEDWFLVAQSGQRLPLVHQVSTGCLEYSTLPGSTTQAPSTTGITVNLSANLLQNGDLESQPFNMTPGPALPGGTISNVWDVDQANMNWGTSNGRSGSGGIEVNYSGQQATQATQVVAVNPNTFTSLKADGLVELISEVTCRVTLEYLDVNGNLIYPTSTSFSRTGQFQTKTLTDVSPSTARFARATISVPATSTAKLKSCKFDNILLQQEVVPSSTQPPLGIAGPLGGLGPLVSSSSFALIPPGSLVITNIPATFAPNADPFQNLSGRTVPFQTLSVSASPLLQQLHHLTLEGSAPTFVGNQNTINLASPGSEDAPLVRGLESNEVIPFTAGTSLYTNDITLISSSNNPLEITQQFSIPSFTSVQYPTNAQSQKPHVVHIVGLSQVANFGASTAQGDVSLNLMSIPNGTSTINATSLFRSQVSITPQSSGQLLQLDANKQISLPLVSGTFNIPLQASFNVSTSTGGFIGTGISPPPSTNTAISRSNINVTFSETPGIPESSVASPFLLPQALRGEAYSASLSNFFSSLTRPYQLSALTVPNPECSQVLTISLNQESVTGFVPVGIGTLICDFTASFATSENISLVQHDITAPLFFRIRIASAPPLPLLSTSEFFMPQSGSFPPKQITFTNTLTDILFDGQASHTAVNGIDVAYNVAGKKLVVSGTATTFVAAQEILVTAKDAVTLQRIEQTIRLQPMPILNVGIPIINSFTNVINLETQIVSAFEQVPPTTQQPPTTAQTSTTGPPTTQAPTLLSGLTLISSSLPDDIQFDPLSQSITIPPENTLVGTETFAGTATINSVPTTLNFTISISSPALISLPSVTALEGSNFSLSLGRYIQELSATPATPPFEFQIDAPRWLQFDGRNQLRGQVPTFTSETVTVLERIQKRVYSFSIIGQSLPQPTQPPITAPPPTLPPLPTQAPATTAAPTTTSLPTTTTEAPTTSTAQPTTSTPTTVAATTAAPGATFGSALNCFSDLINTPAVYVTEICKASSQNIVEGVGINFLPQNQINRAEATKVMITGPAFANGVSSLAEITQIIHQFQNRDYTTNVDEDGDRFERGVFYHHFCVDSSC